MKPNEYKCALCGMVYEKKWSDEEAEKEMEQNFPGFTVADCAVVCDDCYKAFVKWRWETESEH